MNPRLHPLFTLPFENGVVAFAALLVFGLASPRGEARSLAAMPDLYALLAQLDICSQLQCQPCAEDPDCELLDVRVCCEITSGLCFAVEHDSECPVAAGGYVLGTCRWGVSLPDGTIECLEN